MMKLQIVTGTMFKTRCVECLNWFWAGNRLPHVEQFYERVYADLDGQPFVAYYCENCAVDRLQECANTR